MRKRIVGLLVVLALVLTGGGIVLAMTIRDVMETKAEAEKLRETNEKTPVSDVFHDPGYIYMTPLEPKVGETVTLRLRTKRYNVCRAQIQYTKDNGVTWETADMSFEKQDKTGYYDIWKGKLVAEGDSLYYRFIVSNKDMMDTVYYDTRGIVYQDGGHTTCWQIVPGHDVPDWAMGALWYNIMPDAFYNGNTTNDKQISGKNTYVTWNRLRKGLTDKYGGDLDGVEGRLDYIDSLYVDAIYMSPIQKSYQNAGYGPVHWDEVESTFGNEQDLVEFADAVHEHDMKLMGDVVLTFALEDSYYFDKNSIWPTVGAYESKDSIYKDMFKFYNWPDNFMVGWESPSVNMNTDVAKNLLYAGKDSYLTHYASIFDGYRFDCGGWLWGTTDTDDVKTEVFVKEIRKALREVDEDFFLLSESDATNMNTGTWDAQWNIGYMPKLQDYAKGLINETLMAEAMYNFEKYEKNMPRSVALCLHNMISDHDSYRVAQEDDYLYNAAVLIQMTYLGSPSVFYGEEMGYIREPETGVGTIQSFYALDWDESNWDQSRLNFYKAMGELRKQYSCVKTGVVNLLGSDVENSTITFGRWDENGAVITVASQNEENIQMEIEVKQCDIVNGTILTDWLTGKQYEVKDGKVTVDVIPGGSVFVTGKKSSSYRQTYVQSEIGHTSKKDSAIAETNVSFAAEGKGSIEKATDNFTYLNTIAYGGVSVYGNIRGDGKGTLMLRNSLKEDDVYYAAVVNDKKLSIVVRTKEGEKAETLVETDCSKNTYVKLERTAENTFAAYTAELNNGNLGAWELLAGSEASMNMDQRIHYGFAALKGEVRINNVTAAKSSSATFDTFDNSVRTVLFDNINADFVSVADGKLTITNSKKQTLHYLLTNAMDNDWTFKTMMGSLDEKGEYAGVVCQQDEENYIIAGRTTIGGKDRLFLGEATNGTVAVHASVADTASDKAVIIQLQRAGAYYSAVYSADNGATWNYIGKIYANYSEEHAGILVAGQGAVSFDWVSFGDSINDGISVNTPYSPVDVDVTYNNAETAREASYEFLTGDWSVVTGGWLQADKDVFAQASAVNNLYTDLYAEATVEIQSGDGWAGLAFGKTTPYTDASDGFVLKYDNSGKLILTRKGVSIAEAKLEVKKGEAVRLVISASDGNVIVYAGQKPAPVMVLHGTGYYNGYVSFCTEGVTAHFGNFHHGYTSANWSWISGSGNGVKNMIATTDNSSTERQIHTIATLTGYGFTDFVCTAQMSVVKVNQDLETKSGILLCAAEGRSAAVDGVFVYMDAEGNLKLDADGTEKASYALPEHTNAVVVMVVKQSGVYKVFLQGQEAPVLEYTEEFNRGGMFTVYTINGRGSFQNLNIENLQPNQNYADTKTAKSWADSGSVAFLDDFNTGASESNYYLYDTTAGTYEVRDGALSCTGSTDWTAGATVAAGSYSDFTMEFKLRFDASSGGWMSVGMRKAMVNGNHNNSGLSLMISPGGSVFFFDSVSKKNMEATKIKDMKTGEWNAVKIVANGSTITAYVNGEKMATYTDTTFFDGFISFTSGMTRFSIDDLKITPMN